MIYGCQIWGQEHSNKFKKGKATGESNKDNKFLSNNDSVTKKNKEPKLLKLKHFITLQNILFVKDPLTNQGMTSFNKIFQPATTTHYQNTRSGSSFQLRKYDFKIEKCGLFSIINKRLSDWNQVQKHLKANLKDIKHSELKNIVINHLSKQYMS